MATGDKLMTAAEIKAVTDTKLDKASVYNGLDKTTSGFALDARKGKALNDSLSATQSGIAIIVSGDRASMAVPVGGYAYIKNNTHGLAEGLYTNTSSAEFPTVGGTADSTVFTAVSGGGLNNIFASLHYYTGTQTVTFDSNGVAYLDVPISDALLCVIDTKDWDSYLPLGNNHLPNWGVKNMQNNAGQTRTVKYYALRH